MGNLVIYKASAGSGKTFRLALEYIKLLIQSPSSYRQILAVTFTNKATAEMKERILSQLYGIANQLTDSQDYYDRLEEELGVNGMFIRENARKALHNILHDYSFFHVETIDSFFQTVMRNLAHELQLSNNLAIDLDQKAAIGEAVDEMMEQLIPGTPEIQWILDAIADQIGDNRSWNISRPLKGFAENLFSESYQKHHRQLDNLLTNNFTNGYKNQLRTIREKAKESLQEFYETYHDSITSNPIQADWFNGKSKNGFQAFFKLIEKGESDVSKYDTATIQKFLNSTAEWPNKSLKGQDRINFMGWVEQEWYPLMTGCYEQLKKISCKINTCSLLLRNLNELRLLNVINSCLNEQNMRNNRFLLASTNHLLSELIKDKDAPFIFEKLGTQLKHIMIDEFQDTSRMQWNNFRSLLIECLSSTEGNSLIVGDIKQSIYRWRSGDWKILARMKQEQLPGEIIEEELDTNYRSMGNIISFNDRLFEKLRTMLIQMGKDEGLDVSQIEKAYEKVELQKITTKNKGLGYVNVTLLNPKAEGNEESYEDRTLNLTGEQIMDLHRQGVAFSNMAILVRAKTKNVPLVAKHFSTYYPEIPLVSDEAFKLGASKAIRLVINALQLLLNPQHNLAMVMVADTYLNKVQDKRLTMDSITSLLNKEENELEQLLPEEFIKHRSSLLLFPLYELVEKLIDLFQVNRIPNQEAYLYTFLDELNQYCKERPIDIPSFLNYWKETLQDKTIPSGKVDGIRIMSIHASKGLEFDHVIIPFCDFSLEKSGDTLWCEPTEDPYNQLPTAPVQYGPSMKDSIFQDYYLDEKLQQWIDNLNLLYVALTRPKCNMWIIGRLTVTSKKQVALTNVSGLLFHALGGQVNEYEKADFMYEEGEFYLPAEKQKKISVNPLLQHPDDQESVWTSTHPKLEFRQSHQSQQFLQHQQEESEDDVQQQYMHQGILLHRIFSNLKTADGIDAMLRELEMEGQEIKKNIPMIRKLIDKGLSNKQVRNWFSNEWKISNECTILTLENGKMKEKRPDRVMIGNGKVIVVDFKFGKPKPDYSDQVKGYINLLQGMGYEQVEGYLWYVYNNKIVKV